MVCNVTERGKRRQEREVVFASQESRSGLRNGNEGRKEPLLAKGGFYVALFLSLVSVSDSDKSLLPIQQMWTKVKGVGNAMEMAEVPN